MSKTGIGKSANAPQKVMTVFLGLLAAQFVSSMSNTIIANAMPVILAQIGGMPDSGDTGELDFAALPDPVNAVVRGAYGKELGMVFFVMAGFALAGLIAVSFVKGTLLRSSIDTAQVRQILEQEDEIVRART